MTESTAAGTSLDELCINTIRTLSMDAVQRASSGHPGTPMALAPLGYLIYTRHLKHHPEAPDWADRDRFILSAGHASMLLYSLLHLTGYEVSLEDVKNFRQWGSPTAGHPEYGHAPGVETTTGPLGQGFANGVGMAIAERRLAALYNRPGHEIVDHHVYAICSDGDLMEGVASEAASLAGHLRLGKLIYFWDDNRITIDGSTDLSFTEDVLGRFEAYGWHTVSVEDGNDLEAMDRAIREAKEADRPSMIRVRTVIGYGSPEQGGHPRGARRAARRGGDRPDQGLPGLGWRAVPHPGGGARAHAAVGDRGREMHGEWQHRWNAYRDAFGDEAGALEAALGRHAPGGVGRRPAHLRRGRQGGGDPLRLGEGDQRHRPRVPWLVGGSADLAGSNKTTIDGGGDFDRDPGGTQPQLRGARARHGLAHERHGAARRRAALRRHLPHLLGLHAAGGAARRADEAAGGLRVHARQRGAGRGRADPPADRAARLAPRDPRPRGPAPLRRRGDGGGVALRHGVRGRARSSWRSPGRTCRTWSAREMPAPPTCGGAHT
jgi:transketolase